MAEAVVKYSLKIQSVAAVYTNTNQVWGRATNRRNIHTIAPILLPMLHYTSIR